MTSPRSQERTKLVETAQIEWQPTATPGVHYKLLRSDRETGTQTVLLKFDPGAQFPSHNHPGGEELYVIEGEIQVGRDHLNAGDYLYTPPGGKHPASSKTGCLIFVTVGKPIEIIGG